MVNPFISPLQFFESTKLFFWDSQENCSILDFDWISRDINHSRHQHRFPIANVEFRTVTGTDDMIAFDVPIAEGAIIMGADISNGIILTRDIEHNNRPAIDFNKQPLAVWQISGANLIKFCLGFVKLSVIEHK